jgi:hypothetical protein
MSAGPAADPMVRAISDARSRLRRSRFVSLANIVAASIVVGWLTAAVAVDDRVALPGTHGLGALGGVALLTGLALVASWVPVTVGSGMVMIMSTAPVMAGMLLAGPTGGAWIALVGCTEPRELRGDVPLRGVLESHALLALAATCGGAIAVSVRAPVSGLTVIHA